ncbi:nucleotide exchange factor GrpE [Siansivirga zeaxanthinifaciens]|uniref:Protein GrpE n=1 Tax=Siansivirga zeaxanthinifaciens CC-SAMT-1 TaxID=1454006 RepID=A0A0C5W045_9FLAO|nr:nucleotide exchange factor GrpE [Siansivirga zeaxanthinifaciens]AJR04646.1 molecular chaperone GrpE [Siansivirga zeaxanthinifaciens CC-SAMT-1]
MSKKESQNDIEKEQLETVENETVEVDEQVVEEQSVEDKLQEELKLEKDKFLRLFAEFENYKRRTSKERIELFKTASQDVMVSLLPVIDDFDRAYAEISKTEEKDLLKGVELISNKLKTTLQQKGLEVIEAAQGDVFNADNHEAITQIPAPTEDLKGKIIDVIEKGYKLGDKVIRFPKVVIGQ